MNLPILQPRAAPPTVHDRPPWLRRAAIAVLDRAVAPFALAAAAGRARRGKGGAPRSLWLGPPLPTLPVLAKAERLLGIDAATMAFETSYVTGAFDGVYRDLARGPLGPYAALVSALSTHDIVHVFHDRGLLPQPAPRRFNRAELGIFRRVPTRLIVWTYGADVRTRSATLALGAPNLCSGCPAVGRHCVCDDAVGAADAAAVAGAATAVFSMGDMIPYTPAARTDLHFWPIDLDARLADGRLRFVPAPPGPRRDGPLRVAHAPNNRAFKGTEHLLSAITALRARGVGIELDLIERVGNDEAIARFRAADVVFDQCLAGFHGYTAHEAMALAKPVIAFIRDPSAMLLAAAECPILSATPADLAGVLEGLERDRARLTRLGLSGRAYIERHHSVPAFAARLARAYAGLGIPVAAPGPGPRGTTLSCDT